MNPQDARFRRIFFLNKNNCVYTLIDTKDRFAQIKSSIICYQPIQSYRYMKNMFSNLFVNKPSWKIIFGCEYCSAVISCKLIYSGLNGKNCIT